MCASIQSTLSSEAIKRICLSLIAILICDQVMIGDLTVGDVDSVAGISVDVSRSKLVSMSDSSL